VLDAIRSVSKAAKSDSLDSCGGGHQTRRPRRLAGILRRQMRRSEKLHAGRSAVGGRLDDRGANPFDVALQARTVERPVIDGSGYDAGARILVNNARPS